MKTIACAIRGLLQWLKLIVKHHKHHDNNIAELLEKVRRAKKEYMLAQTLFDTSLANLTTAVTNAAAALAATNPTASTPDATVQAYISGVDAQTLALSTATPPPPVASAAAKAP